MKVDKVTLLCIAVGSYIAGRKSRRQDNTSKLEGLLEGIPEGYSRALIELHLAGEITKEVFEEFAERV